MANLLNKIIGHSQLIEKIQHQILINKLPGLMLFSGPLGIGKKQIAFGLAQALNCEKQQNQACGKCGSCIRFSLGQAESLLLIAPEQNQIKVDESKKVIEFFNLQKVSKSRFVIIDDAEFLNPQSGNSLLKTLEEPPPDSFIFLITSAPWKLLPTIRSRAVRFNFSPLRLDELKKINPQAPDWILQASFGQVARVQELLEWNEKGIREDAFYLLQSLFYKEWSLFDDRLRKLLLDRGHLISICRYLISYFRDLVFLEIEENTSEILNLDQKEKLIHLKKNHHHVFIDLFKNVQKFEIHLKQNGDPQLAFEKLFFEVRNVY